MILFLNVVLALVLVLSIVLFTALRNVGSEAIVGLGDEQKFTVAEKQEAGAYRMWSSLSVALVILVLVSFVLINI